MKTLKKFLRPVLAIAAVASLALAPLAFSGCQANGALDSTAATAVSAGTALAVNKYPAAAPLVEMFAGAVRGATAAGPISPAALSAAFAPYIAAGQKYAATISPKNGAADVAKFAQAILDRYTAAYPALQKGEATAESIAQAVEAGA